MNTTQSTRILGCAWKQVNEGEAREKRSCGNGRRAELAAPLFCSGESQLLAANSHNAHERFLDVGEFALALVFFLGAVGESFFQKNQVAAEFELGEN
jgi:hypothetical protein